MLKYENMDKHVEEKEMQEMAAISNDWLQPLSGEFKKAYYKKLYQTVKHEYETRKIFPRRMIYSMHLHLRLWRM